MRKNPDKQLETPNKQLSNHYGDIGIKAVAAAVEPRSLEEEDQEKISSKSRRSALDRHKTKNE